jgi:hypothetical protein
MVDAVNLQKTADDAKKEASDKKGNQYLRMIAHVDPTSFTNFRVREDVVNYFGIDPVPDNLADTDTPFVPKKTTTTTTTTGKKANTVVKTGAGSMSGDNTGIVGRTITISTNGTGLTRKYKGADKPIKQVTIRVPASMNYSAVILWINTCFKDANKKPTFFKTSAGGRVRINSSFTDKTKLPNRKN